METSGKTDGNAKKRRHTKKQVVLAPCPRPRPNALPGPVGPGGKWGGAGQGHLTCLVSILRPHLPTYARRWPRCLGRCYWAPTAHCPLLYPQRAPLNKYYAQLTLHVDEWLRTTLPGHLCMLQTHFHCAHGELVLRPEGICAPVVMFCGWHTFWWSQLHQGG